MNNTVIKELDVRPGADGKNIVKAWGYIAPDGEESIVIFVNGYQAGSIPVDNLEKIMEEARIEL